MATAAGDDGPGTECRGWRGGLPVLPRACVRSAILVAAPYRTWARCKADGKGGQPSSPRHTPPAAATRRQRHIRTGNRGGRTKGRARAPACAASLCGEPQPLSLPASCSWERGKLAAPRVQAIAVAGAAAVGAALPPPKSPLPHTAPLQACTMAARNGAEALYRHKLSSLATAESTLHCIEARRSMRPHPKCSGILHPAACTNPPASLPQPLPCALHPPPRRFWAVCSPRCQPWRMGRSGWQPGACRPWPPLRWRSGCCTAAATYTCGPACGTGCMLACACTAPTPS